ncbi:MAG TPA: MFS transporter [Anaerolineae bacterium]|nr:MFS transporter [Anaerolineae bacterium]
MADRPEHRRFLYLLTFCLALQMLGGSLLFTVYARKIATFGEGVAVFGLSATVFSITALIAAPQMGKLADRWGRRPVLMICLSAPVLTRIGLLLAPNEAVFIGVRALSGALTAGLIPASLSIVADIVPPEKRGRWIGFVNGGSTVGFALGPPFGGWLYDQWGLSLPFYATALASLFALLIPLFLIPETLPKTATRSSPDLTEPVQETPRVKIADAIPRPYGRFLVLLVLTFSAVVAWRFIEPQFHFYIYDTLGWTSALFGACISGYSILSTLARIGLGQLSDRFGRKPILMIGLIVHAAQYVALLTTKSFYWLAVGVAGSGLGEGLFMPALNALYLDVVSKEYSARILGLREAIFSLAGLVGPALAVIAADSLLPRGIFTIGGSLIILSALLVPMVISRRNQPTQEVCS